MRTCVLYLFSTHIPLTGKSYDTTIFSLRFPSKNNKNNNIERMIDTWLSKGETGSSDRSRINNSGEISDCRNSNKPDSRVIFSWNINKNKYIVHLKLCHKVSTFGYESDHLPLNVLVEQLGAWAPKFCIRNKILYSSFTVRMTISKAPDSKKKIQAPRPLLQRIRYLLINLAEISTKMLWKNKFIYHVFCVWQG